MKITIGLLMAALLFSCSTEVNLEKEAQLLQYLEDQHLFKLRKVYDLNTESISRKADLQIQAQLLNTFNKNRKSNEVIDELIELYEDELTDSLEVELFTLKADNYFKLFDYKSGYMTNKFLLEELGHVMDSVELAGHVSMKNILEPLQHVPPQVVKIQNDNLIPLSRDVAGLMNISVRFGQENHNMIFDTGAGMSVIKKSFAQQLGLEMLETSINVNAAQGSVVKSSLAVSDSLYLGDILVTNVVFLVMEDEMLNFPQISFFPLGAIGFPVIEELREISITRADTLIVPKEPGKAGLANLRLDGLQPLVYLYNGSDTLEYSFDTGATKTHFTSNYYHRYKDEIERIAHLDTISTASAGGRMEHHTLRLDSTMLHIGQETAVLKDLHVHPEHNETFGKVYGNLGQDLVRYFDRFTLNFEEMFLEFK
ncbi:MAG: hypothetical protein GY790_14275 [Bacteroidetes bacterium]|nr:hypothetical protein [Bacteroidota bacterium]